MRQARTMFAVAMLVLFASATFAAQAGSTSQASPHQHPAAPAETKPGTQGKMTMNCQSMMAEHQKMMEDMKAMDTRLDTLVQTMNSATGPAKVDATAAVVSELVSQRKTMRERMGGMQAGMMQHMMEHMQAGGAQGMMQCPMMKEMGHAMKQ